MLSMHKFCCYMCLPNALLLRRCGLHILPTILFITLAYIDYFYRKLHGLRSVVDILVEFEPMYTGFESRESHNFFLLFFFFVIIIIIVQICKFNITVSTQILLLYYPLLMMARPPAPSAF